LFGEGHQQLIRSHGEFAQRRLETLVDKLKTCIGRGDLSEVFKVSNDGYTTLTYYAFAGNSRQKHCVSVSFVVYA